MHDSDGGIHVNGCKEAGAIMTAFDATVLKALDRFHLVMDAIGRLPQSRHKGIYLKRQLVDKQDICKYGEDLPEIRNWKWSNLK